MVKRGDGTSIIIPIHDIKKTDKKLSDKSDDLSLLQEELDKLKGDKESNERIIQELLKNLRRYKTERLGFESEERQKKISEYERRQKELTYINNAIRIKNEQLKALKILIQTELELNKQIEEENKIKSRIKEKEDLKKIKHKMKDITKKQHEKNKKFDMEEKEKELTQLKKQPKNIINYIVKRV